MGLTEEYFLYNLSSSITDVFCLAVSQVISGKSGTPNSGTRSPAFVTGAAPVSLLAPGEGRY